MSKAVMDALWDQIEAKATPEELAFARQLDVAAVLWARKLNFINALKRARQEAGLSQRALAKLVGMQQHDLCRLEKGMTNPTFETQQKLLAQLGIEVEYRFTKRPESKISSATKSKRELQKTA